MPLQKLVEVTSDCRRPGSAQRAAPVSRKPSPTLLCRQVGSARHGCEALKQFTTFVWLSVCVDFVKRSNTQRPLVVHRWPSPPAPSRKTSPALSAGRDPGGARPPKPARVVRRWAGLLALRSRWRRPRRRRAGRARHASAERAAGIASLGPSSSTVWLCPTETGSYGSSSCDCAQHVDKLARLDSVPQALPSNIVEVRRRPDTARLSLA